MGEKKLSSAKDMTQGEPWKCIAAFAMPMLLGNMAQQLYNTADSVIVGKYVGDSALAAVGSAGPMLFLLMALFVGIASGAGIVISQSFGAKDREALSKAIGNCITLTIIACIIIMTLGPFIIDPLLRFLKTPDALMSWCSNYLKIFFYGIVGFFFFNMFSGILRGMGDSMSALIFLLVCTGLNVALDIVFVANFGLEVPGVALATVISQIVSASLCFMKLLSMKDVFDLKLSYLKLDKNVAGRILKLGLPGGVTQTIISMGMMVVQSLTNSMGEVVIACSVIIMRVDGFAMMPNFSFGMTMGTFTGQNVGAGKRDRIAKGMKQGLVLAVSCSAIITLALILFSKYLFAIFTSTESLITLASSMIKIMAPGYLAVACTQIMGGVMNGSGDTLTPMWINIFTSIILRVGTAYSLAFLTRSAEYPNGHPLSLYASLLICWVFGSLISTFFYRRGRWRKKMEESMANFKTGENATA